ncbi:chaperone modulatory protein CbpM [Azospirillum brasilense]|uniref:Chaperone modulatory protein CbpM n=1 Tax=Azospirillum brasilense TaxID=192 RepID=A0A560CR70_AZOBR|nr:chaperone modulator CbpM [Azospirillum brasilense]TWA87347.1 chaperone modulatory protein CbpM [Azospirillum brasilense]
MDRNGMDQDGVAWRTDEVLTICRRVSSAQLTVWVERHWLRPRHEGTGFVFSAADMARLEMICDLREDLALDDEAMPVVLSLLDTVYGLRRRLRVLAEAIGDLPPEARYLLQDELRKREEMEE